MPCLVPPRCIASLLLLLCGGVLSGQITTRTDAVGRLLNEWHAAGTAGGLAALAYENRDAGHSTINMAEWPGLKPSPQGAGQTGPASQVRLYPVVGNCSMASSATDLGSLPRIYMVDPEGFNFLSGQYVHNNLFVYPEHQDHDPGWNGHGGWGDLYPVNTPCLVISQGSSGSDRLFVRALLGATAAIPPEIQQLILQKEMLGPTLQMLLRRSYKPCRSEEDFFTGKANPPVFDGNLVDEEKMVRLAHELNVDNIPPVVSLQVSGESQVVPGKHFFEAENVKSGKLGDAPFSIGRVFRSSLFLHQMVLNTKGSVDLQGRPLTFRWALLQGDPARVRIETAENGAAAKVTVAWHPEMRAVNTGIQTHRVDIGVFANNGVSWGPPSIVSLYMLPNEARFYDERGRTQEICYDAGNPDAGLPPNTDLRWMAFGWRMGNDRKHAGIALLSHYMPEVATVRLQSLVENLSGEQEAWRKLTVDPGLKPQADKAMAELQQKLREGLEATFDNSGRTVAQAFEDGVKAVADVGDLYLAGQDVIPNLVRQSGKPNAWEIFVAARQRLVDFNILKEDRPGHFAAAADPAALTPGEKYQLSQFHLTVLNLALLPEFLDRVESSAYVDQRFTARKTWRDLHHYSEDGRPDGWTRIMAGKKFEFDAEGNLLPQGRGGPAVPVKYVRDEKTGRLVFVPQG